MREDQAGNRTPLSATDFHVLLVLSEGQLYGYAIMKAVEDQSRGAVAPEIGSLYRVIGRLTSMGLVEETTPPVQEEESHPGRARKYYRLTEKGREVARAEAVRLREVLDLATARDLLPNSGGT